jgi:hypothetical protein
VRFFFAKSIVGSTNIINERIRTHLRNVNLAELNMLDKRLIVTIFFLYDRDFWFTKDSVFSLFCFAHLVCRRYSICFW